MKVAVFSDVHGNLPALKSFVAATKDAVDSYLCLGDVVNYGPWNDECLELVTSLPGIVLLEGNHERLFLGAEPIESEIPLVQDFYRVSRPGFTRSDLITALPQSHLLGTFLCTHTIGHQRIYPDTAITIDRDHMVGHTHHAFDIERAGHRLVNPGSVGQNRKRIDIASYAIYDSASQDVALLECPYPFDELIAAMRARGYPQQCLDYYLRKRG